MIIEINLLLYLFIGSNLLYFSLLGIVYTGLKRLNKKPANQFQPKISIIIAARNEESRIFLCLESLEKLEYEKDKFEIILVDDCSSDRTAEIIQSFCQRHSNWRLLQLQNKSSELRGKLNALQEGVSISSGEIIFTTDSDCILPKDWLRKMMPYFEAGVTMVLGHSLLVSGKGFFHRLQEFDNLFSAIVVAALTKMGYAFSSIGRNMAYRSITLESVGGFNSLKKFRSGDDIHLTDRFRTKAGKIDYCADPETFVLTQPLKSKKEFLNQQIRKNSKTFIRSPSSMLLPIGLFAYHVLFLLFPIIFPHQFLLWLAFLCLKFILEFTCLYNAAIIFKQKQLIPYLLFMQIIYPGYIIFLTILGGLQVYKWK
ncbi:glycosyltransferase [candidate division KSB1 bacterium]|nr:glycosyltransferase [candidate division KSB1 bacterium]